MVRHLKALLPLVFVTLAILGTPDDLAAKCVNATLPGHVVIVDDRVVAEYTAGPSLPPTAYASAAEIYSITVGCRTLPTGGRQAMVLITTKTGHKSVVELHLRELVEKQRAWRAKTGRYRAVSALNFYGSSDRFATEAIETVANDTGWSGTVRLTGLGIICHVVVGSAEPQRPGLRPGVPACFASPKA